MPYDGEYAGYRPLQRLVEAERVKQLLSRAQKYVPSSSAPKIVPVSAPEVEAVSPEFIVAIDGSHQEVEVQTGYPGARIGYLTVASVLIDLKAVARLDEVRPADPAELRKTEETATIDAALPGCNVITRTHTDAKTAFREELYDVFHHEVIDSEDRSPLLDTYEALLANKPTVKEQGCPYADRGCEEYFNIPKGLSTCTCPEKRPIWSTDALRIHEGFFEMGSNVGSMSEVMQVWERILLIHLLRALEKRELLHRAHRLAFFIDGPLAVFSHPAWLSAAIKKELQRLNAPVRARSARDLLIVGVEKSGTFVAHFEEVDRLETPGELRFAPGTYFLPTDEYIKRRVIFSDSPKRYGADTYFGRKFFYKTKSGAKIVATIPFLDPSQDSLDSDDITLYPTFGASCALLDQLVSSRYPNAVGPLITAHAQAAIPLRLGAKVLEQLARALMRDG